MLSYVMVLCLTWFPAIIRPHNGPIGTVYQHCDPNEQQMSEWTDLIPVDPVIKTGRLRNGLRYYIRQNGKPENRAQLRLALNAGSVLEDEDQQGLAHFCEHMAFNGTKHFKKQELVDYLELIGMRFGPEINAYTDFDETVYMLEIPTDSTVIVKTAFQVLEDWAHGFAFESEEIDRERGVIIEEWRLGRGAQARMLDKQLPILFQDSKYADRLPIGKTDVIQNFDYQTLRRFYTDWYRPDLMAVIAVGDFDVTWIESLIHEHFDWSSPIQNPRSRLQYPVPDHNDTRFAIATDPEATQSSVSIYFKHVLAPEKTLGDYRRIIIENLYDDMMNQRLDELTREAEPPYLYAISGSGRFVRTKGVYYLAAGVQEGGISKGLDAILTEAMRVKQYGFTETELQRAKQNFLRGMEQAFLERDKTESSVYADEYVRNFLTDEPIPGIEFEYAFTNQYVQDILLSEINAMVESTIIDSNRVILINAPEKVDSEVPSETDLTKIFKSSANKRIDAYIDEVSDADLLETIPEPSAIVDEAYIDSLDITEWNLSNGVRIVLKPTDFKNDQILFTAFSPGGHSLVSDDDYIAAITATSILGEGGVGDFDRISLEKKLAGQVVRVTPFINSLTEGIRGSASPADIETLFQLVYLYFTAPRKDSTAFLSFKSRVKGIIENRSARPESAFQDTIQVTMSQYHHRARPWTEQLLEELDLDRSSSIYRDRFSDASDFTFIFVGSFDPESLRPLAKTYLGSLFSSHRNEKWGNLHINPPRGIVEKTVKKGIESKSLVQLFFTGPFEWSQRTIYHMQSLVSVLRIRLREVLREDMGGTYGVSVSSSRSRYPEEDYTIQIGFGCDPDRVEELTDSVFSVIDSLKTFGPETDDLLKVKETQLREHEKSLQENGFWMSTLYGSYFYESDPRDILKFTIFVDALGPDDLQRAAKKYFNKQQFARFVLLPENR